MTGAGVAIGCLLEIDRGADPRQGECDPPQRLARSLVDLRRVTVGRMRERLAGAAGEHQHPQQEPQDSPRSMINRGVS